MKHIHKNAIIAAAACAAVILCAVLIVLCTRSCKGGSSVNESNTYATLPETEPEKPFSEMTIGNGITVTKMFPYTGVYVEDGSDTPVTGITACTVENNGTDPVELLIFTLRAADGTNYLFEVSSLLPGQRVNVLDKGKSPYDETDVGFTLYLERYAVYQTAPAMHEDKLQVFCSGSTIRLTNLTEETMKTCRVYFKYRQNGTYIGGVTFAVKATDLKPGDSALLTPSRYNEDNCEILFVTYE